jgi:hypothetical protein
MSFGTPKNPHTEYITFDVVDMTYQYNAIFGRGLLNTFEAALHLAYLCLKIPITFGVITVFGSQQEARNIEKGFAPNHKNVHFLWEQHETQPPVECRKVIEAKGEFQKVPLHPRVPDKTVCIGTEANQQDQAELLSRKDVQKQTQQDQGNYPDATSTEQKGCTEAHRSDIIAESIHLEASIT